MNARSDDWTPGCCAEGSCSPGTCSRLPEPVVCHDCKLLDRCETFGISHRSRRVCDFYPRRFDPVERDDAYRILLFVAEEGARPLAQLERELRLRGSEPIQAMFGLVRNGWLDIDQSADRGRIVSATPLGVAHVNYTEATT